MNITINDNGHLCLKLEPGEADDINVYRRGYWQAMADLFESHMVNGGYQHFNAGDGNPNIGLTSAPCVAESMDTKENGDNVIVGRLWWFPEYETTDDLAKLMAGETVVYTLAT